MSEICDLLADRKIVEAILEIGNFAFGGNYVLPGLVFTVIFGMLYIRYQSLVPVGIALILVFAFIMTAIPTPFMSVVVLFMAFTITTVFYAVIVRNR